MFPFYIRNSFRNLFSNKAFSAINILGLSVGMAAAVLIFLWVQNETSFDSFQPRADRVYRITSYLTDAKWTWETSPLLLADEAKKEIPEIEKAARLFLGGPTSFNINGNLFLEKNCAYVDKEWFNVFRHDFIYGNARTFLSDPFNMLISSSIAKKYFGDQNPVGQIIRKDSINYTVQGVIADPPANSSFRFDLILSVEGYLSNPEQLKRASNWGMFNYTTFLRLKEKTDPKKVAQKLTDVLARNKKANDVTVLLTLLQDIHFETALTNSSRMPHINPKVVYIFSILGLVLLVIACINYINLTTGKASLRAKEVSIKKIVGAKRSQLLLQFLADSLLFSFIALIIAVVIVRAMIPLFSSVTERNFENALYEPATWKILLGTLLVTTILNGIYPALMLSSFKPLNVFRGITVLRLKDVYLRKSLVVVQFALSVVMIISTIVIFQQLKYIQQKDLGYNHSQVLSFNFPYKVVKNYTEEARIGLLQSIKTELQSHSVIQSVSLASESVVNVGSSSSGSADWEGRDTTFEPTIYQLSADVDYKKVFRLEMKEGRWFLPGNIADRQNIVLNETAVKTFNLKKPYIGRRFDMSSRKGVLIGVVKDFHFQSLHEPIKPLAINNDEEGGFTFFMKIQPGKNAQAINLASSLWKRYVKNDAFDYAFEDESFDNLYRQDQRVSMIILVFAILAIVISVLGLFGLSAFAIDQRRKEIGIRKVLGATIVHILTLLSKDFVKLVLFGIIIASPLAWWMMHKWLEGFAYRINISAWFFIAAGVMALAIAIITICSQGIKAVVGNPVRSLRTE